MLWKIGLNGGSYILLYFVLFAFFSLCVFLYCFVCQYQSSDWLSSLPLKWPRLCCVGDKLYSWFFKKKQTLNLQLHGRARSLDYSTKRFSCRITIAEKWILNLFVEIASVSYHCRVGPMNCCCLCCRDGPFCTIRVLKRFWTTSSRLTVW